MKKVLALLLAVMMLVSVVAGCAQITPATSDGQESAAPEKGDEEAEAQPDAAANEAFANLPETVFDSEPIVATPEMYPDIDFNTPYTVKMYLIGNTPNDLDKILSLVNEYLEKFNTKLEVTMMSWSDYTTMYPLVLAGGEDIDCIFTAPWCMMYTEVEKGSFYTLTEDFINKYMPLSKIYQPEASWEEAKVGGKIVVIPSNNAAIQAKIVGIRQDIADKYGIDKLSNWDDFMNFMLTVAEKETPESGIYAMAADSDNTELWHIYRQQFDTFYVNDSNLLTLLYSYTDRQFPTADDIKFCWGTDWFRDFAHDMKKLADAGCWSRSALSNTISEYDSFAALQGAAIAWNGSVFQYMERAEETEGVYCNAYDLTSENMVGTESYINNAMAIAAGSKDPARTAMLLDILHMDTYVHRLLYLGIEGEHYTIDEKGNYTELEAAVNYSAANLSLSWANTNNNLHEAGVPEREQVIIDSWNERATSNPVIAFTFDEAPVSEYTAAIKEVLADYVPMLMLGLVDDVDATIDEMMEKCNNVGLETVMEEFANQFNDWVEANK